MAILSSLYWISFTPLTPNTLHPPLALIFRISQICRITIMHPKSRLCYLLVHVRIAIDASVRAGVVSPNVHALGAAAFLPCRLLSM